MRPLIDIGLPPIRRPELIALIALLISLIAMSIDGVLPALAPMAEDLVLTDPNARQFTITVFLLCLAGAQLVVGPLSDSIGRVPTIFIGLGLYLVGCLLAATATDYTTLLIGRAVQGVGAAAPRIVANAVVRDRYEGREMAQTLSLVMTLFILMPILAPSVGQAVEWAFGWRAIFWGYFAVACTVAVWAAFRLPETLAATHRRRFHPQAIGQAAKEVLSHRATLGYTLAMAAAFACFMGYIASAQQILQELYGLGDLFVVAFGLLAASVGVSAFINSRLVMRFGMHRLIFTGLIGQIAASAALLLLTLATGGVPPFPALFATLLPAFFCVGVIFGNLNALAMQPMGHIAGTAASLIGAISTALATALGAIVAQAYNETVTPLAIGFLVFSGSSLALSLWAKGGETVAPAGTPPLTVDTIAPPSGDVASTPGRPPRQ